MKYLFILDVALILFGLFLLIKDTVKIIKARKNKDLIIVTQKIGYWIFTFIFSILSVVMLISTISDSIEYQDKLDNPNYSEFDYSNDNNITILDEEKYQEFVKSRYIEHYTSLLENSQRNMLSSVSSLAIVLCCLINGKIFIISKDFLLYDNKKYRLDSIKWKYQDNEKSLLLFDTQKDTSKPIFNLKLNELQNNKIISYFEENFPNSRINC